MRSEVKMHHGAPALFIDGRPSGAAFVRCAPSRRRQFAEQGFKLFNVSCPLFWTGPDRIDGEAIERKLAEADRQLRGALYLFEIYCDAPPWWLALHPGEQHRTADDQVFGQSMASVLWLEEQGQAVAELVRHLERSHRNIVGYLVLGGHTSEWFYRTGVLRYLLDRSAPMRAGYGRWLARRYRHVSALRRAWHDARVTFASVQVPERRAELRADVVSFRDPARNGRRLADFYEYYAQVMADAVRHFCRIVKDACGRRKVCGAYYGHVLDWHGNPQMAQHVGHLALGYLLDFPEPDFLVGPNSYQNRALGGDEYCVAPVDSLKLRGKLWIAENDTRTHLSEGRQQRFGMMFTPRHGESAVKRAFSRGVAAATGLLWFELFKGWYDSPRMMALLKRCDAIAGEALRRDRASAAEIAVIIDERSLFYQTLSNVYLADPIYSCEQRLVDAMQQVGAPFDLLLQQDLADERTHGYKLYLFANACQVDRKIRRVIREKLQVEGKTLAWFYAPGYVTDSGLSVEAMRELTGIRLGIDKIACELIVRLNNGEHALTRGLESLGVWYESWCLANFERHFGTHRPVGPLFYVNDPRAEALGYYTATLKTALATKAVGNSTAVFCGAPFAPPELLRRLCRQAGAHIYLDSNDVFWANKSYLGFHVLDPGRRRIVLPAPRRVREAFGGQLIGEGITEFQVQAALGSTHLFALE